MTYVIAIDGKSGSGKTMLAKKILLKFPHSKHIELDNYIKNGFNGALEWNKDRDIDKFITQFYDLNKVHKTIRSADSPIIILDGLFLNHPSIKVRYQKYIYLNPRNDSDSKINLRLQKKYSNLSKRSIEIYQEVTNNIWRLYTEKYRPEDTAHITL